MVLVLSGVGLEPTWRSWELHSGGGLQPVHQPPAPGPYLGGENMVPASQLPGLSPASERVGGSPLFLLMPSRGRTEAVPLGEPIAAQFPTQALGGSCQ